MTLARSLALFALALSSSAFAEDASGTCGSGDSASGALVNDIATLQFGDERPAPVYNGTTKPTHVPLTEGQMMAIGTFGGCTGTVIADQWVLTARHCGLGKGTTFCVGSDPKKANICIRASAVYNNSSADMTLVKLERKVSEVAPQVEPIPLFTDSLDRSWIGKKAEAAGYGQQENGRYGEREFTAEPIYSVSGHTVSINGEGKRGVCFGDSGGPLMVVAADGSTRVAGALSEGDSSCVGIDHYTRVDTNRQWLEQYLGKLSDPQPVVQVERAKVECPQGASPHTSNTPAFADSICKQDGKYLAYHSGAWWTWQKTVSSTEMQFVNPQTGEVKVLVPTDLAQIVPAGTLDQQTTSTQAVATTETATTGTPTTETPTTETSTTETPTTEGSTTTPTGGTTETPTTETSTTGTATGTTGSSTTTTGPRPRPRPYGRPPGWRGPRLPRSPEEAP